MYTYARDLEAVNGWASFFHAGLAAVALVAGTVYDAPFVAKFDRTWNEDVEVAEQIKYPTCQNNPDPTYRYKASEWSKWLECISPQVGDWRDDFLKDNGRLYAPVINEVGEVPVWLLLFIFCVLTSASHFVLWYYHYGFYTALLRARLQPVRWLEYSVTSSIMILVTAALSKVTDFYLLLFVALSNMLMNLCGGLVFEVLDYYDGGWVFGEWFNDDRLNVVALTKWLLYFASWLVFVLSFTLIFDAFYSGIAPFFEFESVYLWEELFGFVTIINWSLFACYFAFPAIHVAQIGRWVDYETGELLYIASSFVAKGTLVAIYLYAAVEREDQG